MGTPAVPTPVGGGSQALRFHGRACEFVLPGSTYTCFFKSAAGVQPVSCPPSRCPSGNALAFRSRNTLRYRCWQEDVLHLSHSRLSAFPPLAVLYAKREDPDRCSTERLDPQSPLSQSEALLLGSMGCILPCPLSMADATNTRSPSQQVHCGVFCVRNCAGQ